MRLFILHIIFCIVIILVSIILTLLLRNVFYGNGNTEDVDNSTDIENTIQRLGNTIKNLETNASNFKQSIKKLQIENNNFRRFAEEDKRKYSALQVEYGKALEQIRQYSIELDKTSEKLYTEYSEIKYNSGELKKGLDELEEILRKENK